MKSLLNVCRCCLSKLCNKDMCNEYFWLGVKERYSDMLFETFNITISVEENNNLICEGCIARLRDAAAFKQLVLESEQKMTGKLTHVDLPHGSNVILKEEDGNFDSPPVDSDSFNYNEYTSDGTAWQSDHYRRDKDLMFVKLEEKQKANVSRRPNTRHRAKLKLEQAKRRAKDVMRQSNVCTKNLFTDDMKEPKTPQTVIDKVENSVQLIQHSNMCVFTIRNFRYGCFYCKEKFLEMTALRQHCDEAHHCAQAKAIRLKRLRGCALRNVDVSNLTCSVCSQPCPTLDALQQHLALQHHLKFNNSAHFLIPFVLTNNQFRCVLCTKEHNKYRMLSIHMHCHYSNYVCETCGKSYMNPVSLRNHVSIKHKEKKCSVCPATFLNSYLRTKHMKKAHQLGLNPKRYCMVCNATFNYSYKLNEHMIAQHGAEREVAQCKVCGKQFFSKMNLNVHMRSVHLRERNHECAKCGTRFSTKHDLRRHETSHLDVRAVVCGHCDSRFKTKDSWRRHVKKQHTQ